MSEPLGFYDHHRQSYGHLPIEEEAKFMIGGYTDGDGLDERGEFKIELLRLHPDSTLTPRLGVFSDAYGALQEAIAAGLLDALSSTAICSRDDLASLLIGLGFRDCSDLPVGSPLPTCPCCGQRRERGERS